MNSRERERDLCTHFVTVTKMNLVSLSLQHLLSPSLQLKDQAEELPHSPTLF